MKIRRRISERCRMRSRRKMIMRIRMKRRMRNRMIMIRKKLTKGEGLKQ